MSSRTQRPPHLCNGRLDFERGRVAHFFIFNSYLKLKTDRDVQGCPPYAEENVNGYTWNGGKVTLGMNNEQVFAALGPPTRVRQFDWDTVSQIIAPHYAANHK